MGGLFGKKVSANSPRIISLQLTTSCWGGPIPIAFGQCRAAPNMVWQADFKSIPYTSSSGGKGGPPTTGYTYQTAIIMALCEGTVSQILNTWDGNAIHGIGAPTWIDEYGNLLASGSALGDFGLTLFGGSLGQATWSYLTANHPTQAIGYSGLCCLAASVYQLDTTANLPQQTFEIIAPESGTTGVTGVPDAACDVVLNQLLTNQFYGAGFPTGQVASLAAMRTYCIAQGLWVSPCYTEVRTGADILTNLALISNCGIFFSEGLIKSVPYGEQAITANGVTYTPISTVQYALTDDDYLPGKSDDPVIVDRSSPIVSYNCVQVRYKDRSNQYNDNIAEKKDDASIAAIGLRVAKGLRVQDEVECYEICDPNVAHTVAQILLQRCVYLRNTYKWTTGMKYCLLEPMDIVTLTENTGSALSAQPVRITAVTENEDNTLDFEAEDYLGTVCTAPLYGYQIPGGYASNYNADPGDVDSPVIFDAPARLTRTGHEIWIAAVGDPKVWGGATVWMSLDGDSYRVVGVLEGRARYGVTSNLFPLAADPDTTNSLDVNLTVSSATLLSATQQEVDALQTICIVDNEVIGYQTAALTGAFQYQLGTYIRRGLMGTGPAQHQIGARFVRLDSGVFALPYDPVLIGTTVHFKFTSFNFYNSGEQGLDEVVDYPFVLQPAPGNYLLEADGGWGRLGDAFLSGNTAIKSLAGNAAWDSTVYTNYAYANGVFISGTIVDTVNAGFIGLAESPASSPNYPNIDFGLGFFGTRHGGVSLAIYEAGTQVIIPSGNFGSYAVGDSIQATYDGRTVRYYHGTTLLRSKQAPGLSLHGVVALYDPGASLSAVDFGSTASSPFDAGNFLSTLSWTVGTFGSQQNFLDNFDGAHNDSVVLLAGSAGAPVAGPSGSSGPLWRCTGDGTSNNGGWTNSGDLNGLDPTKTYRMSVWVQSQGGENGNFLFGADLTGATSTAPGSPDTSNACFLNIPVSAFNTGEWYLAVGILHGAGYSGDAFGTAGLYRQLTGQQVIAGTEYQQTAGFTYQTQRAQLNGANDPSSILYLTQPRFEELNGAEPTILSMLGVAGTALISQNGATEVYLFQAGPDSLSLPSGSAGIYDGILVTPPPFDCTVIATVVIGASATGSVELSLRWFDGYQVAPFTNGANTGSATSTYAVNITSDSSYTLQDQFQHSVQQSNLQPFKQDALGIRLVAGSGSTFTVDFVTIQLEFIKR